MLPLEGKSCYEVYHGRTKPCGVCPVMRAIKTRKLEMNEAPLSQKDEIAGKKLAGMIFRK